MTDDELDLDFDLEKALLKKPKKILDEPKEIILANKSKIKVFKSKEEIRGGSNLLVPPKSKKTKQEAKRIKIIGYKLRGWIYDLFGAHSVRTGQDTNWLILKVIDGLINNPNESIDKDYIIREMKKIT